MMTWETHDIDEFHRKLHSAPPAERDLFLGLSPGGAAARLGVSRNAIYQAVKRGTLKGFALTQDGKMVARIIPDRSLTEYENSDTRAKHTPKMYRTA